MIRVILLSIAISCIHCSCKSTGNSRLPVLDYIQLDKTMLKVEALHTRLDVPWNMEFGPDGFLWITEQDGYVKRIDPRSGQSKQMLHIAEVYRYRTLGLLSMAIDPDFTTGNPYIYLHYTVKDQDTIVSHLVRYTMSSDTLSEPRILLKIPANTGHNGSRLQFSPDKKLYWGTGDTHHGENAQDIGSYTGKVLRLNRDGSFPSDNPWTENPIWAYGFRNIQGLCFGAEGRLYTSEHGDAIEDEVNLIRKGANYGWPYIEGVAGNEEGKGHAVRPHTVAPMRSWTPVIAPAGMTYYANSSIPEWYNTLLLVTLKTQSLRVLKLNAGGDTILQEQILLANRYGRLRSICVSPSGEIYLATSNRDWNPPKGFPREQDDMILKISKVDHVEGTPLKPKVWHAREKPSEKSGTQLYQQYCASCHREQGEGLKGVFPSLQEALSSRGGKDEVLDAVFGRRAANAKGKSEQLMPSFGFLADEELQRIVNYVRKEFGSKTDTVSLTEIQSKRTLNEK